MPWPRSRKTCPLCVPGGTTRSTSPSTPRHREARPQHGFDDAERDLAVEVVALAGELGILVHARDHDQVAARAAEWSRSGPRPPRGSGRPCPSRAGASRSTTARAVLTPRPRQAGQGSRRARAGSFAGGARRPDAGAPCPLQTVPRPPQWLHVTRALPGAAPLAPHSAHGDSRSTRHDRPSTPGHRLLEGQLHRHVQIVASAPRRARRADAVPRRPGARRRRLAVVDRPRHRITEDAIGLGDLLEERPRASCCQRFTSGEYCRASR